jgi:Uma2 family endonuclease
VSPTKIRKQPPRAGLGRIGRRDNGLSMTTAEFDAVRHWDERYRYELVRGVLIVSPAPGRDERGPNGRLGQLLLNYADTRPPCAVVTYDEEEVRCGETRRRADRAIWVSSTGTVDPSRDTPAILVEIVSARRRDRLRDYEIKRDEYRAISVKEYWVFDRFRRQMTVYRFHSDRMETLVVPETGVCTTDLLPGFELPVARLQAEADAAVARRPGGEP